MSSSVQSFCDSMEQGGNVPVIPPLDLRIFLSILYRLTALQLKKFKTASVMLIRFQEARSNNFQGPSSFKFN
jgi:hypothetical protein